jgi:hypothetical protein
MLPFQDFMRAHKHHVVGALILSFAIVVALIVGQRFGLGGISVHPELLLAGLLVGEAGRSITAIGESNCNRFTEYVGVCLQGLAWWVWTLNWVFLSSLTTPSSLLLHMALPMVLLTLLPVAAHHLTRHSLQMLDLCPEDSPVTDKRSLKELVAAHKNQVLVAFAVAITIFAILTLGSMFGLGGIAIEPGLLLLGLIISAIATSMDDIGERLGIQWLEYAGVFCQGLAWWVWSINLPFVQQLSSFGAVMLHMVAPAFLLATLPVVAHFAARTLRKLSRRN